MTRIAQHDNGAARGAKYSRMLLRLRRRSGASVSRRISPATSAQLGDDLVPARAVTAALFIALALALTSLLVASLVDIGGTAGSGGSGDGGGGDGGSNCTGNGSDIVGAIFEPPEELVDVDECSTLSPRIKNDRREAASTQKATARIVLLSIVLVCRVQAATWPSRIRRIVMLEVYL